MKQRKFEADLGTRQEELESRVKFLIWIEKGGEGTKSKKRDEYEAI